VTSRIGWKNGVDVFTDIRARFADFTYTAYVGTHMNLFQEMTFHGEAGLIRLTAAFNARTFGEASVELHQDGQDVRRRRFPEIDQYKLQVEAFGRSAQNGSSFPCPLEFSKGTQEMIDLALASAETI